MESQTQDSNYLFLFCVCIIFIDTFKKIKDKKDHNIIYPNFTMKRPFVTKRTFLFFFFFLIRSFTPWVNSSFLCNSIATFHIQHDISLSFSLMTFFSCFLFFQPSSFHDLFENVDSARLLNSVGFFFLGGRI